MKKIHIVIAAGSSRIKVTKLPPKRSAPGSGRYYTPEQIAFVRKNFPGRSYRSMTELFNRRFGLNITEAKMKSLTGNHRIQNGLGGHFPKGNIPFNKGTKGLMKPNVTSYKKGNVPKNYRPVGSERIGKSRGSFGYTEVKVAEPNKWKMKHVVIWEKANGPKPKGHCVIFADGDKTNFALDNLLLVTRSELARMNHKGLIYPDANLTKTGLSIAKLEVMIGELKRNER